MPPDKKTGDDESPIDPKRTKALIHADLATAKAKLAALLPKVEADRARVSKQAERIATKRMKWKVDYPDEPFDPDSFTPPMRPFTHDEALHQEFHQVHYDIEKFETELAELAKAKGQAL